MLFLFLVKTSEYSSSSRLSEYIRDVGYTGTKVFCREAGCGACAVTVTVPSTSKPGSFNTRSINSVSFIVIIN